MAEHGLTTPPLGLYIHFPWCVKKCPYCDFNSHQLRADFDEDSYLDALLVDLQQDLPQVKSRQLSSIFMGGGTPSLFSACAMQRLLQKISELFAQPELPEVTMEANPGSQEFGELSGYLAAGINRLSFGVQSFDLAQLKKLGRIHNAEQAIKAVKQAQKSGFDNLNIDLMFALPQQNLQQAKHDLLQAIELQPTHISYYQLTIEENTLFAARPPKYLPNSELQCEMYLQGKEILEQHGYQQYEVSAYAKRNRRCQHNLNYWQFGDYLGIGAGAHGKITDSEKQQVIRTVKQRLPQKYLRKAHQAERLMDCHTVTENSLIFEYLLNHLRLKQPLYWRNFEQFTGLSAKPVIDKLKSIADYNWFSLSNELLRLNEQGFLMSDEILQMFLD